MLILMHPSYQCLQNNFCASSSSLSFINWRLEVESWPKAFKYIETNNQQRKKNLWIHLSKNKWWGRKVAAEVNTMPNVSLCVYVCMWLSSILGKIISIETGALRATGRPGWEDLVRKCIYAFFQPQGKEPSHAKKLLQEGEEQTCYVHRPPGALAASKWQREPILFL